MMPRLEIAKPSEPAASGRVITVVITVVDGSPAVDAFIELNQTHPPPGHRVGYGSSTLDSTGYATVPISFKAPNATGPIIATYTVIVQTDRLDAEHFGLEVRP